MPLQGAIAVANLPRALPWACWAFSPLLKRLSATSEHLRNVKNYRTYLHSIRYENAHRKFSEPHASNVLSIASKMRPSRYPEGRFYKLVSTESRVSMLLGCIRASRTVSFCFSFSHVARYAPLWKTKTSGTIATNPSQANL